MAQTQAFTPRSVVYTQPTVVTAPTAPHKKGGMPGYEWVLIIITIIIAIGIIIWVIWFLGLRCIGQPAGGPCSQNSDCGRGTYCNAFGTCQVGDGKREGQLCEINTDCLIGLRCDSRNGIGQCTRDISPIF